MLLGDGASGPLPTPLLDRSIAFRCAANGICIESEAKSWSIDDWHAPVPQAKLGGLDDILLQKLKHNLIAIVEIWNRGGDLVRSAGGDAGLENAVQTDVDA